MRSPFESVPASAEPVSENPTQKERSLLERAAKGPLGRWTTMAFLALSTQGCQSWRVPIFGTLSGEGGAIRNLDLQAGGEASVSGGDDKDLRFGFKSVIEQSGNLTWWNKEDGIYDPREIRAEEEANEARERLGDEAWEEQQKRAAYRPKGISRTASPKIHRIRFEQNEVKPRVPTAIVHPEPGDKGLSGVLDRGLEMFMPILNPNEGVRVEWHAVVGWDRQQPSSEIEKREAKTSVRLDRTKVVLPLIDTDANIDTDENAQFIKELRKHREGEWWKTFGEKLLLSDVTKNRMQERGEQIAILRGPVPELALRLTPMFEPHLPESGEGMDFEQIFIQHAFDIKDGSVGRSPSASVKYPGRVAQIATVVRLPIPPKIEKLPHESEAAFRMRQTERLGKIETLKSFGMSAAFKKIQGAGTGETRLMYLENKPQDPDTMAVVAVMDDPEIRMPKKDETKRLY